MLRPWLKPVQVGKYAGKRAAVDAYSWLHKGAYSCALELGTNNRWWIRQRRDAPYVRYCIHRAQMLRHYGITPVIVFDGDRLPAKGGEEKDRRERRAECLRKGHERLAARDRDGATFMFAQGVDITPAMAHELIAALKREGFEFIVAPYEADAQIAALAQLGAKGDPGGVDIVFTEDSDLVAYGCPLVLFKLDKFGEAQELLLEDVMAGPPAEAAAGVNGVKGAGVDGDELDDDEDGIAVVGGARGKKKGGAGAARSKPGAKGPLNFVGWKHEQFLELCVLSGCDFRRADEELSKEHAFGIYSRSSYEETPFFCHTESAHETEDWLEELRAEREEAAREAARRGSEDVREEPDERTGGGGAAGAREGLPPEARGDSEAGVESAADQARRHGEMAI